MQPTQKVTIRFLMSDSAYWLTKLTPSLKIPKLRKFSASERYAQKFGQTFAHCPCIQICTAILNDRIATFHEIWYDM